MARTSVSASDSKSDKEGNMVVKFQGILRLGKKPTGVLNTSSKGRILCSMHVPVTLSLMSIWLMW